MDRRVLAAIIMAVALLFGFVWVFITFENWREARKSKRQVRKSVPPVIAR
jgi:hypothetical protein